MEIKKLTIASENEIGKGQGTKCLLMPFLQFILPRGPCLFRDEENLKLLCLIGTALVGNRNLKCYTSYKFSIHCINFVNS